MPRVYGDLQIEDVTDVAAALAAKQPAEVGTTGVDGAQVLVLDDGDPVPAGTPAGTVIVRTT
jgi:hypothetical protein